MFAGIPVKGENGVGFARAVSSLLPLSWHHMRNRMRSRPGEGRQCVRHARYRRYQPDSFLFPLSRAPGDKTPDHPRRYLLHRFTTIRPRTTTPIRPQFLSLRPRNLAPLLFFLFFFFCRPCVSNNLRWTAAEIASVSFGSIVIEYVLWIFFFFFFLFVSSRFSRFIVVYLAIRFFLDHLKRTFEEVAQIFFTWNVIDYVLTIYFFFLFLLALRSCYFRWIYFDLVFKYDFWEILSLFLVRTRKRATRFSTNWIGIHIFDHFFFVAMFIDLSLFNPILVFGIKFFDNIIIFIWLK